jgi:hypothetical protein
MRFLKVMEINIGNGTNQNKYIFLLRKILQVLFMLFVRDITFSSATAQQMVQESRQENVRYGRERCIGLTASKLFGRLWYRHSVLTGRERFSQRN